MTGEEHFQMAERLLASCRLDDGDDRNAPTYPVQEDGLNSIGNALAAAQVHATLALAAASASTFVHQVQTAPPMSRGELAAALERHAEVFGGPSGGVA